MSVQPTLLGIMLVSTHPDHDLWSISLRHAMYQNVQNDPEWHVHNEEVRPIGYCSSI